mgnify:CR=1 FL=1|jgi:hypothetical protein|nr:MAG TPA: hypothetical protein [Caudoviricetes sp.]
MAQNLVMMMYVLYNHKYYLIHNAIGQYYVREMEELFE